MPTDYSRKFYRARDHGSLISARHVVSEIVPLLKPKSVVDVGCGTGAWLRAFKEMGVTHVHGFDGDWIRPEMLMIDTGEFSAIDFTSLSHFTFDRTYDLTVSVEVAEHLPSQFADRFIGLLTSVAPVILFSAAVPLQGGTGHVNEQWPSYWVPKFDSHGFRMIDSLRWKIWTNPEIEWWYRRNLMLFVQRDLLSSLPAIGSYSRLHTASQMLFTQTLFGAASRRPIRPRSKSTLVKALPRALRRAISRAATGRYRGKANRDVGYFRITNRSSTRTSSPVP